MQVVIVSRELLFSPACTEAMLDELATVHLGMSAEALGKIKASPLAKGSKDVSKLPTAKLRTILVQKFSQHEVHGADFNAGRLRLPLECLATPEQPKQAQQQQRAAGGAKQAKAGGRPPRDTLKGEYWVAKTRNPNDPGKDPIWDQMWANTTFEDYFAKAPAKGVTKTGRVITSWSEMLYAVKCGWIVMGAKPQQQQAA